MQSIRRRSLLVSAAGAALAPLAPLARAQERRFEPQPGHWRTFEITTSVDLRGGGPAKVWVPVPSVDSSWQRVGDDSFTGNATGARVVTDARYGARMVLADFKAGEAPTLVVTSRFETQDRSTDWARKGASHSASTGSQIARRVGATATGGSLLMNGGYLSANG